MRVVASIFVRDRARRGGRRRGSGCWILRGRKPARAQETPIRGDGVCRLTTRRAGGRWRTRGRGRRLMTPTTSPCCDTRRLNDCRGSRRHARLRGLRRAPAPLPSRAAVPSRARVLRPVPRGPLRRRRRPVLLTLPPRSAMKRLVGYFLNGLIFTAPVALTVYVVLADLHHRGRLAADPDSRRGLPRHGGTGHPAGLPRLELPGPRLLDWVEELLERLPWGAPALHRLRDVFGAFVGEKKRFSIPVMVTSIPARGSQAIGFLTQDSLEELALAGPRGGLPAAVLQLCRPDAGLSPRPGHAAGRPSAKVMAFVVSGGVAEVSGT